MVCSLLDQNEPLLQDPEISQLDYEDALLSNPIVRLLRDWHYWWHDNYWRAELAQSEYFNLKDAMVVDNHLIFYEQGGPVLKSKCGYDHLVSGVYFVIITTIY